MRWPVWCKQEQASVEQQPRPCSPPSIDHFAIPECSLNQGPMNIARSVAREWQTDGYLKPGKIVGVRRLTTEELMSGVMGWLAGPAS